jgi:hypothetical protein
MSSVYDQREIHDISGAVSGGCVGDHCVGGRTSNILSPVPGHQRDDKKKNQFFAANSSPYGRRLTVSICEQKREGFHFVLMRKF